MTTNYENKDNKYNERLIAYLFFRTIYSYMYALDLLLKPVTRSSILYKILETFLSISVYINVYRD